MANVFISYSRRDRERVVALASALEGEGLSVWWDPNLVPGRRFREMITEQLAAADCVVVVWTAASLQSDWVQDEADEGRQRGVLIPVKMEPVKAPAGFRQVQAADLSQWTGNPHHPEFRALVLAAKSLAEMARLADRPPTLGASTATLQEATSKAKRERDNRGVDTEAKGDLTASPAPNHPTPDHQERAERGKQPFAANRSAVFDDLANPIVWFAAAAALEVLMLARNGEFARRFFSQQAGAMLSLLLIGSGLLTRLAMRSGLGAGFKFHAVRWSAVVAIAGVVLLECVLFGADIIASLVLIGFVVAGVWLCRISLTAKCLILIGLWAIDVMAAGWVSRSIAPSPDAPDIYLLISRTPIWMTPMAGLALVALCRSIHLGPLRTSAALLTALIAIILVVRAFRLFVLEGAFDVLQGGLLVGSLTLGAVSLVGFLVRRLLSRRRPSPSLR